MRKKSAWWRRIATISVNIHPVPNANAKIGHSVRSKGVMTIVAAHSVLVDSPEPITPRGVDSEIMLEYGPGGGRNEGESSHTLMQEKFHCTFKRPPESGLD